MQQQINLYQPAASAERTPLSSGTALRLLIVIGLALLGIWGFGQWQIGRLRVGVEAVRAQHQAQENLRAAGVSELESLTQEQLDAHVASLAAALDVKTRALQMLQNEAARPVPGFAARLEGLARRHVEGIWLDRLTLGGTTNALSLSGTTLSPPLVPEYLRSLAADPALSGAQIDDFLIEQTPAKQKEAASVAGLRFRAGNQALGPDTSPDQAGREQT